MVQNALMVVTALAAWSMASHRLHASHPVKCFCFKKKKCHTIWVILLSTLLHTELKLGSRSPPLDICDKHIFNGLCAAWKKTQARHLYQLRTAVSYSHQHFIWAKERVEGLLWRQIAMYEASLAFICSANTAWCKKHIVPSLSNHTMSLNLSMVNEALTQGMTPSLKMCCLQQFCEQFKMQVGGEVAANWSLTRTVNPKCLWRACKQSLLFLQVEAINHVIPFRTVNTGKDNKNASPSGFCFNCCTKGKSQPSSVVPSLRPFLTNMPPFPCKWGWVYRTQIGQDFH